MTSDGQTGGEEVRAVKKKEIQVGLQGLVVHIIDGLCRKYLRFPTLKCKDMGIRKSKFVTKLNSFRALNLNTGRQISTN